MLERFLGASQRFDGLLGRMSLGTFWVPAFGTPVSAFGCWALWGSLLIRNAWQSLLVTHCRQESESQTEIPNESPEKMTVGTCPDIHFQLQEACSLWRLKVFRAEWYRARARGASGEQRRINFWRLGRLLSTTPWKRLCDRAAGGTSSCC